MVLNNKDKNDTLNEDKSKRGRLLVISAPSGAGKTTLCKLLRKKFPEIIYSISSTTRKPRIDEKDGVDYYFISRRAFEKAIKQGQWVEWAKVHDSYYGTSAAFIEDSLAKGLTILMDIDVQGAAQIIERYPEAISVFIMPPDLKTLKERLTKRGTDSASVVDLRLKNAIEEMNKKDLYDYVIINDDLNTAQSELIDIVSAN